MKKGLKNTDIVDMTLENGVYQETTAPTAASKHFDQLKRYFGKAYAISLLAMLATSCSSEEPTTGPDPTPVDKDAKITAFTAVGDDVNDKITGTANFVNGTGKIQLLDANGNAIGVAKTISNGDFTLNPSDLPNDKLIDEVQLEVTGSGADNMAYSSKDIADVIKETTTPNTAPTLSNVVFNNFNENNVTGKDSAGNDIVANNTPAGTVVGGGNFADAEGNTVTIASDNPNFEAVITGTDTFEIRTTANLTQLDYDNAANTTSFTIGLTPNDGTENGVTVTGTSEMNDLADFKEYVDRPDVTYTKTDVLGGATVTEDLSYLDAAGTRAAERIVDVADNDPNTQTLETQLRVADDSNGNEVWESLATQVNEVENAGLGDATALAVAGRYEAGSMGMKNFAETTQAESDANNDATLKLNNIIEEAVSYKNGVNVLAIQWGAENAHYDNAPSTFNNETDKRIARQVKVYLVIWGQLMHSIDVTNATAVREASARAMSMAEGMTDQEMYDFYLEKLYGGNVTAFENFWGN